MTNPVDVHFSREELQGFVERGCKLAAYAINPRWRRAYEDFVQAASVLDAFIARSSIPEPVASESE